MMRVKQQQMNELTSLTKLSVGCGDGEATAPARGKSDGRAERANARAAANDG